MRINTNTTAVNAFNNLSRATNKLSTSVERLSSGLRINHANDDPAGLAIAEKIRTQVKGLARASMNAQDGVSLLQTAEGALGEVQNMLQRIRELAVQAANGTLTSNDRVEIQREVDQLLDEVDRTSIATEFNTKRLLDGSLSALTSVDDAALTPIITGDKVVEGNFRVEAQMTPGQAEVLKTDIFRVVAGEQYEFGNRGLASDIVSTMTAAGDRLDASDMTLW
ncbi:MAG: flagellin, partial [Armatimonadia bacterium]|nr:flagellin [Armatimonadia bacterium]